MIIDGKFIELNAALSTATLQKNGGYNPHVLPWIRTWNVVRMKPNPWDLTEVVQTKLDFLWEMQCHKPTLWGWLRSYPHKWWWLGEGLLLGVPVYHIIFMAWYVLLSLGGCYRPKFPNCTFPYRLMTGWIGPSIFLGMKHDESRG